MDDFLKENRLQIKKAVYEENAQNEYGFVEVVKTGQMVTENYRFTEDEGHDLKKDLKTLFDEHMVGMPLLDEKLVMTKAKSKELEKKNKKYSDKDRRDSVKLAKSIRKDKMTQLIKKYNKKKEDYQKNNKTMTVIEEIEFKEKMIEYDAKSAAAYIKAYVIMDDKEKVDLAMNDMRTQYRKIGMYLEYIRSDANLAPMIKQQIMEKVDAARQKLNTALSNRGIVDSAYFSWKKIGPESMRVVDVQPEAQEEEQHEEQADAVQEEVLKEQHDEADGDAADGDAAGADAVPENVQERKPFAWNEKREKMLSTGVIGEEQKKKNLDEWFVKDHPDAVKEWFDGSDEMDDEEFARKLMDINENIKANVGKIRTEVGGRELDDITLGFGELKSKLMDRVIKESGKKLCDADALESITSEEIKNRYREEFKVYQERKRKIEADPDFDLKSRGDDIWKSKAMQSLVVDGSFENKEVADRLKAQIRLTDKALDGILAKHGFFLIKDKVKARLKAFLGDEALFGRLKRVKLKADQYISMLSIYDRSSARTQKDFVEAYKSQVKGVFAPSFDSAAQIYLSKFADWNAVKDRRENMSDRLERVGLFAEILAEKTEYSHFTKEEWDQLAAEGRKYIKEELDTALVRVDRDAARDAVKEKVDEFFGKFNDKVINSRRNQKEQIKVLTQKEWHQTVCDEPAEKKVLRLGDDIKDIPSYKKMIIGEKLLGSAEVKEVLGDEEREFLGNNINAIIGENAELIEKLPFMAEVKGEDQLEILTQDQFEKLCTYLKDNLCCDAVKANYKRLNRSKKLEFDQARRNILFKTLKNRQTEKSMRDMIHEEGFLAQQKYNAQKTRIMLKLGTDREVNLSRNININFNDIPEDRADGEIIAQRQANMKKATSAWKKVEELGPEAVAQMRIWIGSILGMKNSGGVIRNRNARHFLAWLSGAETIKSDNSFFSFFKLGNIDVQKTMAGQYTVDTKLQAEYERRKAKENMDAGGHHKAVSLVDDIREIFSNGPDAEELLENIGEGNQVKNEDAKYDFGIELCLCGAQDVLMGPDGLLFKGFFAKNNDDYKLAIEEASRFAMERLDRLDEDLKDYPEEVASYLRKKLRRAYLTAKDDTGELIARKSREIERITREQLDRKKRLEEARKSYENGELSRKLNEEEENKWKAQTAGRESEIEKKDKELAQKKTDISSRETAIKAREKAVKPKETELIKKENAVNAQADKLNSSELELQENESTVRRNENSIKDLERLNAENNNLIESNNAFIKAKREEYYQKGQKSEIKKTIQAQLDATRANNTHLNEAISNNKSEIKNLQSEIKSATKKADSLRKKIDTESGKLETLRQSLNEFKNALVVEQAGIAKEKEELEKSRAEAALEAEGIRISRQQLENDKLKHAEEADKNKHAEESKKKEEEELLKTLESMVKEGDVLDDARVEKLKNEIMELGFNSASVSEENHELIGANSLTDLKEIYHRSIDSQGVMDKELQDTVKLFEERFTMLENAGSGELKSISYLLIEKDEVLGALMDTVPSVAEKKIKELLAKFKNVAVQLKDRPEHLKNMFLRERLDRILSDDKSAELDADYWKNEIDRAEQEYFAQKNGQKGSIEDNRAAGEEVLLDWTKDHVKGYRSVMHAKEVYKGLIDMHVSADPEMFMDLFTQKGAILLYERITKNYDPNVASVEREFYRQMYIYERTAARKTEKVGDDVVRLENAVITDKELEEFKKTWTAKVGKPAVDRALNEFNKTMIADVIKLTNKELKKKAVGAAKEFVHNYMTSSFKPQVLKEQSDEEKAQHAKARADAKLKAKMKLTDGVRAHDALFFGDSKTANSVVKLSEAGFSLAYKEFNKDARPKNEDATKSLLDSAWKTLSKAREEKRVPSILTDILAEYKILKKQVNAGRDEEDEDKLTSKAEAERLWKIYEYGAEAGAVEEKALDMYTVYAARYWDGKSDDGLKSITREFKNFYVSLKDLRSIELHESAAKAEHAEMCDKMALYVFEKGASLKLGDLNAAIIKQKAYFERLDRFYTSLKKALSTHSFTKDMEEVSKEQYIKGLVEYLRADVINDITGQLNEDEIVKRAGEVLDDSYLRSSVTHGDESVFSTDFYETKAYPGAVKLRDFEKKINELAPEDMVKEYNSLSVEQRQMFAVALYSSRQEESGSLRVIFGVKEEELKANREKFKDYIKGKDVEFDVDYGKSLRKLVAKTGTMKEHFSQTMFREALDFVKKVDIKREELRPKDWKRIDDAKATIDAARGGLLSIQHKEDKQYIENPPASQDEFMSMLEKIAVSDKARRKNDQGFFGKLGGGFGAIKWFKGESIDDLMGAVKKLKPYQMRMLVYVLQNRSALDFTTAGKNEDEGTYSYANKKKRFELIEELTDEGSNMLALTEADSKEMISKAMLSLLSYQLKDNQPLSDGSLTKDDFAEGALDRFEAIDWKLLLSALNLVQEIDNERLRLYTVQQSSEIFKESCEHVERDKADASQKAYLDKKDEIKDTRESFEGFINDMAKLDVAANNGDKELVDALMSGYMALTDKEKALFVRALEHRDILDISQKNLYRNFYSDAERDFVNAKGRDELIDEYILNANGAEGRVAIKGDSYTKAFESLLSTQLDDSLNFTKAGMVSWADKDLRVNKQLLVRQRKTAMDWKLFARALQFVTRASNECMMAAGDKEIYRSTGDVLKKGRMSFDRSFMRSNIHRTGGRLARFLASQTVDLAKEKLGFLGTLADLSEFVVSEETSNFIHEAVNPFLKKDEDGGDDDDDDDDDDDEDGEEGVEEQKEEGKEENKAEQEEGKEENIVEQEEDKEENKAGQEEGKAEQKEEDPVKKAAREAAEKAAKEDEERRKASEVVKNLSTIAGAYSDHKDQILKISGSLKTAYTDIGKEIYKDIFGGDESGREVAEEDKLAGKLKDVEIKDGEKKVTNAFDAVEKVFDTVDGILAKPGEILGRLSTDDFGIVGTVYKYAKMGSDYAFMGKEYLDKYLRDSPEMLESVDNMIKSYLGGFISTKSIGEWYTKNVDGNINKGIKFVVDDRIPKEVQDAIKSFAKSVSESKDLLKTISDYLEPAVGIAMAFKGIYDNVKNIGELSKAKNEGIEKHAEDAKKLEDTAKNRSAKQDKLVANQAELNIALSTAALDTTKHIQQREILDHIGDAVEGVGNILTTVDKKMSIVGLGVETAVTIFKKGLATASFIMQCLNDSSMLKEWFNGAGRGTAERMEAGRRAYEKMNTVEVAPMLAEQINGEEKKAENGEALPTMQGQIRADGRQEAREYTGEDVTFTRRAMGFESNEELNCYMALNMVHSMLFSASDYNVLEEPKIMARVTMTVLGLEDSIGKTDSDTAMKIYTKLRQ